MQRYTVQWQTSIGIGATFYKGSELVYAESADTAASVAQMQVWRRAFRDWPLTHIVIISVS
mgnify:CR=1 FL=1